MSASADVRTDLARRQSALVAALVANGEMPPGFDAGRLRAASLALTRKRAQAVARVWPGLVANLGRLFHVRFAAFASTCAIPRLGGALADGRAFARWLAARRELPESTAIHALAVDLRYRTTPDGLIPRSSFAMSTAWLTKERRFIVAVRLPKLGEFWLRIPLAGRRRHR